MKFLLLCCFEEKVWESMPKAAKDEIMRDYGAWIQGLDETGRHLASAQLQPVSAAKTLRGAGREATVTDGPFAETKEQVGGYHLIECTDHDEAIEIASGIPTLRAGGTVELRPLV